MSQPASIDFRLVARVCHLQRALDQALASLQELQAQIQNQQLLESQLAETEKFSNVQQQIIAQLKRQQSEQQQSQSQVLQDFMATTLALANRQKIELERLRIRTQQTHTEIQTYLIRIRQQYQNAPDLVIPKINVSETEPEVMVARSLVVGLGSQIEAIWHHLQELDNIFNHHEIGLATLEGSLEPPDPLSQTSANRNLTNPSTQLDQTSNTFALNQKLKSKQLRVEELEAELTEQFKFQTRLKHHCQELAAERDHYKQQIQALEKQKADMQEQILQQASQISEQVAATQYWKDRHLSG